MKSAKKVMQKICIKNTNMFTIIAMNFVQEQLKSQMVRRKRSDKKLVVKKLHKKTRKTNTIAKNFKNTYKHTRQIAGK